jgi:hypothetical protein
LTKNKTIAFYNITYTYAGKVLNAVSSKSNLLLQVMSQGLNYRTNTVKTEYYLR